MKALLLVGLVCLTLCQAPANVESTELVNKSVIDTIVCVIKSVKPMIPEVQGIIKGIIDRDVTAILEHLNELIFLQMDAYYQCFEKKDSPLPDRQVCQKCFQFKNFCKAKNYELCKNNWPKVCESCKI